MSVLVVIAEDQYRQAVVNCLLERGHAVQAAADAEEALRLAALHLPTVILVHMGLSDLSAYDLFRVLRTAPPHHQAWMVAVGRHVADPVEYDKAGINASINEDCEPHELVNRLLALPGNPLLLDV